MARHVYTSSHLSESFIWLRIMKERVAQEGRETSLSEIISV